MDKPKKEVEPVETILSSKPGEAAEPVDAVQEPDQTPEQLKPVLDADEIAAVKAKARKQLQDERKAAAKKSLLEQELERLRQEEGMVTGGTGDQMVNILVDLYPGAPAITVNSRPYWHGKQYTVPRHVADTLRDIMYRGWDQERIRTGTDIRSFHAQKRATVMSKVGVVNAPKAAG